MNTYDVQAGLWIAGGVAAAILWPILVGFMKNQFPPVAGEGIPPWFKKYGALLLFSVLTSLILLAIWHTKSTVPPKWYEAFLFGFSWESAIEKAVVNPLGGKGAPAKP